MACSTIAGPILGVKLIPDRNFQHGGLNYGFVEYHTLQGAENALQIFNGRKFFDTEIKVNWAYQNQMQKEDLSTHFHVFVGDLSPEINDETLRKAFAAFGTLSDARVMWDLATGKSRGYGFLAFKDKPDADQAINAMNGEWLGSRAIRVNWANQKAGAGGMEGIGVAGGPMRISNLPPFLGPPKEATQGGEDEDMAGPSNASKPSAPQQPRMPANVQPTKPLNYEVVLQEAPPSNATVYIGNLVPYAQQSDVMPLFQGFGYVVEVRMHSDRGFAFVKLDTHQNAAMAIVSINGTMVHGRPVKCSWGKDKLGSDTSIIANQANGVTSPPLETPSNSTTAYAGWPYGQKINAGSLSAAQAAYYSQYYNLPSQQQQQQNGISA